MNVDALTALFGYPDSPAHVTTITRADQASPWAVTGIAPAEAPGLVERSGLAGTTYVHAARAAARRPVLAGQADHRGAGVRRRRPAVGPAAAA